MFLNLSVRLKRWGKGLPEMVLNVTGDIFRI